MSCLRCTIRPIENKDTGLCASCGADDRKAEKQAIKDALKKPSVPLQRSTKPIAKRSDKRALQEDIYNQLAKAWKAGKNCGVHGCKSPCHDVHHQKGKEGSLLLETKWWFPICREHHTQVTIDSAWAIREGYSISRNAVEQDTDDQGI